MHIKLGFTLVELMVVIVVIAILATLVSIGIITHLADTRDQLRQSATTAIVKELEKYYEKNGEYPSCISLQTDPATALPSVDTELFITPSAPNGTTNSIICSATLSGANDQYAYQANPSNTNATGTSFTLVYWSEVNKQPVTINSIRN